MQHTLNMYKPAQTTPSHPVPLHTPARAPIPDPEPAEIRALTSDFGVRQRNAWSVQAVRRKAVTAQSQASESLFCAAQVLPHVSLSAAYGRPACMLTPATLVGRPRGRHVAEAGTADGLRQARTKKLHGGMGPRVGHSTRERLCSDPKTGSHAAHDKKNHEHARAHVKTRALLPCCVYRRSRTTAGQR